MVILTSTDRGVLSAGLDLKQAAEIRARDGVDILTVMGDLMQTVMRRVSKPIIAATTGSLMAGGMLLAIQSTPLSVKAAKPSVLAAMDLGCAAGLVEANRLHVETYASLDAIEGAQGVCRTAQTGLARQIEPADKRGESV